MTLAMPAALWLLLGIPLLLLLEWRRRRPRDVTVSTLRFWREVGAGVLTARSERRRWTLGTLCRAVAIAAAACAAAGPRGRPTEAAPEVTFLVDVSASMERQVESGERCFDRALAAMRETAAELPAETRVTLRPVPGAPENAITVNADHVDEALETLDPTDRPLAWKGALDDLLAEARGERVDVFTVTKGPDRAGVRWVIVGAPVQNVAITRLAVEPRSADTVAVLARLQQFGFGPVDVEVTLRVDGTETERRALRLEQAATIELPAPIASEHLEIRIAPGGDLAADDRAWAVRSPRLPRVRLADRVPSEVQRALRATEAADIERGPREAAGDADAWIGFERHAELPSQIVLTRGGDDGGRIAIPDGRLVPGDEDLFRGVMSSSVAVRRVREWTGGGDVLAWVAGARERRPAIVREEGRIEILFELTDSSWPADPSFPIFFANWIDSLRGGPARHRIWRTGEPWPPAFGRVLSTPHGPVDADGSPLPERVGEYRLDRAGEVWVSLLDAHTSARGELPSRPPAEVPSGRGLGDPRTWTRELTLLAALLLGIGWMIDRR